jgi:hypothetical protein
MESGALKQPSLCGRSPESYLQREWLWLGQSKQPSGNIEDKVSGKKVRGPDPVTKHLLSTRTMRGIWSLSGQVHGPQTDEALLNVSRIGKRVDVGSFWPVMPWLGGEAGGRERVCGQGDRDRGPATMTQKYFEGQLTTPARMSSVIQLINN